MPTIRCAACGHPTNTATSDHVNRRFDNHADRCYIRWREVGSGYVPEPGCAFADAPEHVKQWWAKQLEAHDASKGDL